MFETPRRAQLERLTPAEHAIRAATAAVEAMAADVRLTDAVVLLGAAGDAVADYVDGVAMRRNVTATPGMEFPPTGAPTGLSDEAIDAGIRAVESLRIMRKVWTADEKRDAFRRAALASTADSVEARNA